MTAGVRSPESGIAALAGLALAAGLLAGCGKPPKSVTDGKDVATAKGDPWEAARKRLRKDTDFAACKAALANLNTDLPADPKAPKPAGLSKDAEAALAALVPLNADDLGEVRPAAFTAHDPVYLAECLYLRDAARSLDVVPRPGQTPEQAAADRADLAFAWVCRQVYLNPWLQDGDDGPVAMPPVPPVYALRRGHGSGYERMCVFLALLQQMNLDGCLVGPPEAKDQPATHPVYTADRKGLVTGGTRGPFWAAGVRVGGDVRLYDPWRGQPLPAPLSALRANPEAHKAWFEDKANVSAATAEDAKRATAFLAVPVNALAPRMVALEQQLKSEIGVRAAVDAAALRGAFADPKPAFWNPPNDRFAYGRASRGFLPAEEGGADRTEPKQLRLHSLYLQSLLPRKQLALPQEFREIPSPDVGERVWTMTAGPYFGAFFNPPSPRERIQRGQFQDAARDLVARQDEFWKGLERLRNSANSEGELAKWVAEAKELYQSQALAPTAQAKQAAVAAVEQLWQRKGGVMNLVVDRVVAELGHTEATYLLALCKHEQAERAQARLDRASGPEAEALRADARAAWQTADGEWQTYAGRAATQAGFPGRAAHAQALAARAAAMAQGK